MKITGEQVFTVPYRSFAVSASEGGYTLNYSVDGENFDAWKDATPAGEILMVTNTINDLKYKLVGNTGEVLVQW